MSNIDRDRLNGIMDQAIRENINQNANTLTDSVLESFINSFYSQNDPTLWQELIPRSTVTGFVLRLFHDRRHLHIKPVPRPVAPPVPSTPSLGSSPVNYRKPYIKSTESKEENIVSPVDVSPVDVSPVDVSSQHYPAPNSFNENYQPSSAVPAPSQIDSLVRRMEAKSANNKAILSQYFVVEVGKPLSECTWGDLRQACETTGRKHRFLKLVLSGRDALPDDSLVHESLTVEEYNVAKHLSEVE